ncbi:receptor like protein 29-like [Trifolium pratense]|uniref:receptor like protein 29-like n=1 Tax=Trifolium pratense TaxID=57577 RepID=UPI001E69715B|nr:receptor like protein 29-like [Trifolium pratense]
MSSFLSFVVLFVFLLFTRNVIQGDYDQEMVMEEKELLGLFEVMEALLDEPDFSQTHPLPCTDTPWPGIECEVSIDDNNDTQQIFHVTKIHIGPDVLSPPCKKSAYLSKSLLKLTFLKTLSLFNCFVTSHVTLPTTLFGSFSSLEHIALQSNPKLYGEIPSSLGFVTNLRVLSLSQNSLNGSIPKEIGSLAFLEQLDLSYNNFIGQIPNEIGGLKSLTILDLSWNKFEGNLPYSIGQLQLLQKMDLSSNQLNGKLPSNVGNLKRLVLLDLSHNFFSGPIPENFQRLNLLEYLIIDDNPIKTMIPHFIGNLWNLKSLSFSRCGLFGSIPNYFSLLKNLSALSLDNNSLIGNVPKNLALLPNLDQLNISYNKLNGVLHFSNEFIEKLGKRLDVRGNNELCINDNKNLSSYLEIASCVGLRPINDKSFAEDPAGIKPSRSKSNLSSSSAYLNLHVIIFTLVLSFSFSLLNL